MRTRLRLAAVVLWAALGGCGGAQLQGQARSAPATTAAGAEQAREEEGQEDPRRAEIERLERQIDSQSGEVTSDAGTAVPPPPGVSRPYAEQPPPTCEDVCQASGSICRAAARICGLADELDDAWAHGRCRRASRTCTNVRRRSVDACGTC